MFGIVHELRNLRIARNLGQRFKVLTDLGDLRRRSVVFRKRLPEAFGVRACNRRKFSHS